MGYKHSLKASLEQAEVLKFSLGELADPGSKVIKSYIWKIRKPYGA